MLGSKCNSSVRTTIPHCSLVSLLIETPQARVVATIPDLVEEGTVGVEGIRNLGSGNSE
jgi:hypothetical protein